MSCAHTAFLTECRENRQLCSSNPLVLERQQQAHMTSRAWHEVTGICTTVSDTSTKSGCAGLRNARDKHSSVMQLNLPTFAEQCNRGIQFPAQVAEHIQKLTWMLQSISCTAKVNVRQNQHNLAEN